MDLERVVEDPPQRLGGEHLEHGRFEHEVAFARVDQGGRLIGAGLHRERAGLHVGELLLDQLEAAERLAELHAACWRAATARATQNLAAPVQLAPNVVRPKSSTVSATLQPLAELARGCSRAGTNMSWNASRPVAVPRTPHLFHPLLDDLEAGHVGRDEEGGDLAVACRPASACGPSPSAPGRCRRW